MQTNTFKLSRLVSSSSCKVVVHGHQLVTTIGARSVSAHVHTPHGAPSEAALLGAAMDAVRIAADAATLDAIAALDPELRVDSHADADAAVERAEDAMRVLCASARAFDDAGGPSVHLRRAALEYAAALLMRSWVSA